MEQKTVLIIDDEASLLKMYTIKFEKMGFLVLTSQQGKEGFNIAKEKQPDLILLDVLLSGKDGFSVLKKLKKDARTRDIPVIMLTNLGNRNDSAAGLKFGAAEYLIKSDYTPQEVVAICLNKLAKS